MFRGCQPEIGHQLPRIVEPGEIPDLGHNRHRHDEGHPAHRLHGLDHWRQAPARQEFGDLLRQALDAGLGIGDGVDIVLEHDLLGGMLEPDRRQPAAVDHGRDART